MKKPAPNTLSPPLTSTELRELYLKNPTPELQRALWELWRVKCRVRHFYTSYLELLKEWPRNSGGMPALGQVLKSDMRVEVDEEWAHRQSMGKRQFVPTKLPKDHMFADLEDEHPEDREIARRWNAAAQDRS